MVEDGSDSTGEIWEACESLNVPLIGLVKIERLGQRLNIPTQGRRVAQTGTKPFSENLRLLLMGEAQKVCLHFLGGGGAQKVFNTDFPHLPTPPSP